MKVSLEQSLFSYLSQFSLCRPSVLCHPSLTFPGVSIKWSILPPLSIPLSPSASAYLCSTFLGWALLVTSVQLHDLLLTPAEHFAFGLSVLALVGKNYCSPYPSFRFWGSRYLCKRLPFFLASLVTDMSLFVGQLWHRKSYYVFLSCWQLTREYFSFYSSCSTTLSSLHLVWQGPMIILLSCAWKMKRKGKCFWRARWKKRLRFQLIWDRVVSTFYPKENMSSQKKEMRRLPHIMIDCLRFDSWTTLQLFRRCNFFFWQVSGWRFLEYRVLFLLLDDLNARHRAHFLLTEYAYGASPAYCKARYLACYNMRAN